MTDPYGCEVAENEGVVDLYGANYGGFANDLYAEVRREAWGEEIGQSSWLTRDELERFSSQLQLGSSSPACSRSAVARVVQRCTSLA
jgi:hypothetical protein